MAGLFSGVDALNRALDYHLQRHNVLAGNIANVDTPGFRPMELVRAGDAETGATSALLATSERHFTSASAGGALPDVIVREDRTAPAGADGNSVSLERESSKIAANDLRYEGAVRVVARQLALLRYAASDGTSG
jgi:flagellar basal-body rod protein FlgB